MHSLTHDAVVSSFYDATLDNSLWKRAADMVRQHFEAITTRIEVRDKILDRTRFGVSGGDARVYEPFLTKYAHELPLHVAASAAQLDQPLTSMQMMKHYGTGKLLQLMVSPMAREWALPNRIQDGVFLPILKKPGRVGYLSVCMNLSRRRANAADLQEMSILSPHLRRAIAIQDMFEAERQELQLYRDVVDRLSHAVMIVNGEMKLLYANAPAEALLREEVVLKLVSGTINFGEAQAHTAIARAIHDGRRDEVAMSFHGIDVALTAPRTVVAQVLPLAKRDPASRIHNSGIGAIFIAQTGASTLPPFESLAGLFGLTPAERRITEFAAKGLSRRDMARAAGVKETTASSQLDTVYSKTGVAGQRELARLLSDLVPIAAPKSDK